MEQTVMERVAERTARYAGLALFEAIRADAIPVERFADFFPEQYLAARWFQDLIWAATEVPDGPYAAAAREHRRSDSSHFRWLEGDLLRLGLPVQTVDDVFRFERLGTRVQLARILARCAEADPLEKMLILVCLESAGAVTLGTLHDYVVRHGLESRTNYLGRAHVRLEEGQVERLLAAAPVLRRSSEPRLLATVELVFDALTRMFEEGGRRHYGAWIAASSGAGPAP